MNIDCGRNGDCSVITPRVADKASLLLIIEDNVRVIIVNKHELDAGYAGPGLKGPAGQLLTGLGQGSYVDGNRSTRLDSESKTRFPVPFPEAIDQVVRNLIVAACRDRMLLE